MEDTGPVDVDGPSTRTRSLGFINKNNQRKIEIREARAWARKVTFGNPRYRFRIWEALQNGTLHPILEKAMWEMGEVMPKGTKRDDLSEAVRGLTMLLRKPLNVDPLAEAKPVVIIEQPAQEPEVPAALPPRVSIVPPARPSKKTRGTGTLKPGEEELS